MYNEKSAIAGFSRDGPVRTEAGEDSRSRVSACSGVGISTGTLGLLLTTPLTTEAGLLTTPLTTRCSAQTGFDRSTEVGRAGSAMHASTLPERTASTCLSALIPPRAGPDELCSCTRTAVRAHRS